MKWLALPLLFILTNVHAQNLKAESFSEFMKDISETKFQYKERGRIFGYVSTESCLYSSQDFIILRHYCYPERRYPARGYTVISKTYGMIEVYEENIPGTQKREIYLMQFPEILRPYLSTAFEDLRIASVSALIEKLYYKNYPACWSTNYSDATGSVESRCTMQEAEVEGIEKWFSETRARLNDQHWSQLLDLLHKTKN